jgi:hypothetical protein
MLGVKDKCENCGKEIKGGEVVYIKMRYPEYDGMTRIKKFLELEGKIICESCQEKK